MKNTNLQNIKLYPQYSGLTEYWADIKDYEGKYQVSNFGRVKSLARKSTGNHMYTVQERLLKLAKGTKEYSIVCLHNKNLKKTFRVHRLVATAFIPNPNNYPQVNHIDGCKTNNSLYNLEWCTNQMNVHHAWDIGLINVISLDSRKGSKNGRSKLTEADIPIIRSRINVEEKLKDIAKDYNVDCKTIRNIKTARSWKHV